MRIYLLILAFSLPFIQPLQAMQSDSKKHKEDPEISAWVNQITLDLKKHAEKIIQESNSIEDPDHSEGYTYLMRCVKTGLLEICIRAIHKGFSVNSQTVDGISALHVAATHNIDSAICELLLKRGANPNIANSFGETPLMQAAAQGNWQVCHLLLEYGADQNQQDLSGSSAIIYSANFGWDKVTELLLQYDANPRLVNHDYVQAIDLARNGNSERHQKIVSLLSHENPIVAAKALPTNPIRRQMLCNILYNKNSTSLSELLQMRELG